MAGYSQKSLAQKLGLKENFQVIFINKPANFEKQLGQLEPNIAIDQNMRHQYDFIHFFTKSREEYESRLLKLKSHLKPAGMIWISWPKKASKVTTDLDENIIREFALQNGLVDVKVCAVDEIWSGLKLVIPVKDRKSSH